MDVISQNVATAPRIPITIPPFTTLFSLPSFLPFLFLLEITTKRERGEGGAITAEQGPKLNREEGGERERERERINGPTLSLPQIPSRCRTRACSLAHSFFRSAAVPVRFPIPALLQRMSLYLSYACLPARPSALPLRHRSKASSQFYAVCPLSGARTRTE